jgi:hypothetical protein
LGLTGRWQPTVPGAAFVGVEIDDRTRADDLEELRVANGAAGLRTLGDPPLIFVGTGEIGRQALDWVLQGDIAPAGVIGIDVAIDLAPLRIVCTTTMVRLVQHCSADDPHAARIQTVTEAIRRQQIDVRCMVLPNGARTSADVTIRAGGAFLAELVANAGRNLQRNGKR